MVARTAVRIAQLGVRFGAFEEMADGSGGSVQRHCVAGIFCRGGELGFRASLRKAIRRELDCSGSWRNSLPSRIRFVDRIHSLHMAVAARSHFEGVDVRLRQSGGGGFPGMAGAARAHRSLHSVGKRDHHRVGGAGNEREDLDADGGGGDSRRRTGWGLKRATRPCLPRRLLRRPRDLVSKRQAFAGRRVEK